MIAPNPGLVAPLFVAAEGRKKESGADPFSDELVQRASPIRLMSLTLVQANIPSGDTWFYCVAQSLCPRPLAVCLGPAPFFCLLQNEESWPAPSLTLILLCCSC